MSVRTLGVSVMMCILFFGANAQSATQGDLNSLPESKAKYPSWNHNVLETDTAADYSAGVLEIISIQVPTDVQDGASTATSRRDVLIPLARVTVFARTLDNGPLGSIDQFVFECADQEACISCPSDCPGVRNVHLHLSPEAGAKWYEIILPYSASAPGHLTPIPADH